MNLGAITTGGSIIPPRGWLTIEQRLDGIASQSALGLRVIISLAVEQDDKTWAHLSLSREDRIPSWRDLRDVKTEWLGDREAYQVFPSSERYVNINPYVLHLWSPLEAPEGILPRFEGCLVDGSATI